MPTPSDPKNTAVPTGPLDTPCKEIDEGRRSFVSLTLAVWGSASAAGCGGGGGSDVVAPAVNGPAPPPSPPPPAPSPIPASPPPAPPEPLAPEPTVPSVEPVIGMQSVDLTRLIVFLSYHEASRYERARRLQVLSGTRATLRFQAYSLLTGFNTFNSKRYTLLIDKAPIASVDVPAGTSVAQFDFDLSTIDAGWRRLDIDGLSGGECCPSWWVFVQRGAVGEQPLTPVVLGTYDLTQMGSSTHMWTLAPGRYNPTPLPFPKREFPAVGEAPAKKILNCGHLVPLRFGDMHRPNKDHSGILSSFDAQAYYWSTLHAALPTVALLDGPRGVGTVCMVTHVTLGTAAPNGVARNNVYFCDPWRVGKVSADGTVTTLAGYRHKGILSHWEDINLKPPMHNLELVGDWSAVPVERRGFHELWGMAWDERTLAIDESGAPIAAEGNEKPHVVGPVMFLADSQRNRIVKLQFNPTDRAPPKVTEFITGLQDPWEVVYGGGLIYVSERTSHRIAAYDASSGAFVRVVVQGKALASIDVNREVIGLGTLVDRQAEPCVAPEGLYLQDDWLYFASKAQAQVRRVKLQTGELQVVRPVLIGSNSKFVKLAVSDGSFGPRGSTFTWTWGAEHFGYPAMHSPDGKQWPNWWPDSGGTGAWVEHFVYPSAGAVGQGRLATAGANEGLLLITATQPGDQPETPQVIRGFQEYRAKGLHLLHGANGFGFYGLPLPWGISSDIDAYLTSFGHARR